MPHSDQPSRRRSILVPVAVAAIAALLAVFAVTANGGSGDDGAAAPTQTPTSTATPDQNDPAQRAFDRLVRRTPDDPLAQGDVDAPVVMIDFSDFQCPYCGEFARTTEHQLYDKYVKTGVLRIEWRDFPYLGKESERAALAARAAADQGGFWKFHDALYAEQPSPNSGELTVDHLVQVAESVGLDGARLRADMNDNRARYKAAIGKDFQSGQAIGVNGTPAFLINGQAILGAQPLSVFEKAIDQEAAEATSSR